MEPTLSYRELFDQATLTARHYLGDAIEAIDKRLGDGYAAKHPELVAAFMQTAARDFHTAILSKEIRDGIVPTIGMVSDSIDQIATTLRGAIESLDLDETTIGSIALAGLSRIADATAGFTNLDAETLANALKKIAEAINTFSLGDDEVEGLHRIANSIRDFSLGSGEVEALNRIAYALDAMASTIPQESDDA